jgi:hypothetical protein
MRSLALAMVVVGSLVVIATASATPAMLYWTPPVKLSGNVTPTGVTCRSASLCIVYGDRGRLLVSSHPSGGTAAWKLRHIDGSAQLRAVACPSLSLCVAYDVGGTVLASRRPIKGPWLRVAVDRGLDSLACPSRSLCVGADRAGDVLSSTDPARTGSWHKTFVGDRAPTYECVHYQDPGVCAQTSLSGISCAGPKICTALDQAGNVVLSTNASSNRTVWTVAYAEAPDSPSGLTAVGCTSPRFCFGADSWGNFLASVNPAAGQSAWSATGLHTAGRANNPDASLDHSIRAVACTSSSACIAMSDTAKLFATANPAAREPDWRPTGLGAVASVDCAGSDWCFAINGAGRVYGTHDAGHARTWRHAFTDLELSGATARFSCPSPRLCVAVDRGGALFAGSAKRPRQSRR